MENIQEGRVEFERCIDFLVKMIELYGTEVLKEVDAVESGDKTIPQRKGNLT